MNNQSFSSVSLPSSAVPFEMLKRKIIMLGRPTTNIQCFNQILTRSYLNVCLHTHIQCSCSLALLATDYVPIHNHSVSLSVIA